MVDDDMALRRRDLGRLALLGLLGIPTLVACGGPGDDAQPTAPEVPAAPRIRGADISFTLQEEARGTRYTGSDTGSDGAQPIETILAAAGVNVARLRLWVDPPDGYSDLNSVLTLARRAHAAGLQILLDLHYSDFWADPTAQATPAAWKGQSLPQLTGTVRSYTADVVGALNDQGTPPSMVQIGNEVTNGMLWPAGQVYFSGGRQDWTNFGALLRAGIQGVQDAPGPDGPARTIVHIQGIDQLESTRYTLDHITGEGVRPDIIGVSYYPFWHGPLSTLAAALNDIAGRYGTDVLVVETSYPWTLSVPQQPELVVDSAADLPEAARFPPTPQGQLDYFTALREVVTAVPDGRGLGFVDWEPGWLPGVDAHPGGAATGAEAAVDSVGNGYANLTLFDGTGAALPALAAFTAEPTVV